MFDLLENNPEAIDDISIEKRATIPGGLLDELSIKDIATLTYQGDTEKQEALIRLIVKACKGGELPYYGKLEGWSYLDNGLNPYPRIKGNCLVLLCQITRVILVAN